MEKRTIENIKKGLRLCIGEKTDGAVMFSAGEWLKYGVLSETEYNEIADAIDEKNAVCRIWLLTLIQRTQQKNYLRISK